MTQAENRPPSSALDVFVAPAPFAPRVDRLALPALGQNIARILAAACNSGSLNVDDLARARVYINGVDVREISPAAWLDLVPVAGDVLNVAVHPLGGGQRGGGGGKNVLQTVLSIAVIALSLYVGGGAATPGLLDALWIRAGAAAAVQVAGTLAVNAMFAGTGGATSQAEANQRAALQGSGNQFRLRAPMPLRLGRQRVAFDMAAGSYTQLIGEEVWLKLIFGLHYGPCTVEDIKIGETLLSAYPAEDFEIEQFLAPGPRVSTIYPGRVVQEGLSDQVEPGEATVHTTATDCERIEVDLTWPQGLGFTTNKGEYKEAGSALYIQVQPAGGGAWTPADMGTFVGPDGPLSPGTFYIQRSTRDTIRQTLAFTPPAKGQWNVRVELIPSGLDPEGLNDDVYWTALRSLEAERPIVDETLSILVMSIRSSEDLNGSLPTVSGIVTPIAPVWNGSAWVEEPTSNPAALVRWLLTGPAAAVPIDAASGIDDSIIDALELIADNDWAAAVDVVNEATQEEVIGRLGRAGRFSSYWNGQRLCFVPDWSKPFPRQIFTGRNAKGYRYRRSFPDPIHAVIVEFYPLDLTAPADEVIVYADGYTAETAELFETLRLDFSCTGNRAFREGRAYLAKRELQVEVHEWQAGIDAVASTYGDRVLVRHPATLYGVADATVDHRRFSGGLVAGLKLDEVVPFEAGKDYGIDIRRADAVIRGVAIVNPGAPSRYVTFASPRAVDVSPERGDLVVVGELGVVTEDLEIVDVDASPDGTATFRGFRYIAAALAQAETGEIPEFTSGLKPRASAPTPRILAANGSPDGVDVSFDIDPVRSALVASFATRWRINGLNDLGEPYPWRPLAALPPNARSFRTPPPPNATGALDETGEAHPEIAVDIELRSVLKTGAVSQPATAIGVLCIRGVPDVLNFSAVGVVRTGADGSTYPAIEVTASPWLDGTVLDLVVQYKPSPGSAWSASGISLPAAAPFGDLSPVRAGDIYDVRARWRTADNWVGDWAFANDVLVPAESWTSYAALTVGGYTPAEFAEALAALAVLGDDFLDRFNGEIARLTSLEQFSAEGIIANALRHVEERKKLGEVAYLPGGVPVNFGLLTETSSRIEGDEFIAESVSVVAAATASAAAAVVTEQTARISAVSALATTVSTLAATVTAGDATNAAAVVTEQTARVNAVSALATTVSTLAATVTTGDATNAAAITAEQTARATADSAFASNFTLLGAKNGAGSAWVLAGSTVQVDGSGTSLASYISGVSSSIGTNSSAIATEISARSSGDSALATSISSVSSTVGGHTASITTLQTSVNGISSRYAVSLTGGRAVGFELNSGGGATSSFLIQADEFGVSDGSTTSFPFSISGGIVRMSAVEVDTVKANVITAAQIIGGEVTASASVSDSSVQGLLDNDEMIIATLYYTSRGGRLEIDTQTTLQGVGGPVLVGVVGRIRVDGSLLDEFPWTCPGSTTDFRVRQARWTPSAGSRRIELIAYTSAGAVVNKLLGSIKLTEFRNG